jgi:heptosyltransferase-2
VSQQLRASNANLPGGRGQIGGEEQAIRTVGSALTVEALADTLIERGYSVVLLGGPGEAASAQRILDCVSAERRGGIRGLTKNTILQTAGVLRAVDCCVGNDTGVLNMAAATDKPSICLLGKRPLLLHDPLIHCLNHATLDRITVDEVFAAVRKTSPAASNAE